MLFVTLIFIIFLCWRSVIRYRKLFNPFTLSIQYPLLFIVIPQIINGIFGGPIVSNLFGKMAMGYVVVGGICMIVAAIFTLILVKSDSGENPKELEKEIEQIHF